MATEKSPFPPFMDKEVAAPTAAPVAAEAAAEAAPKVKKAKKVADGERKTPAKAMNPDQIKEVLAMVKDFSYSEIAEKLGITRHQVNRVLMETKNILKKSADTPEKKAKVDAYIKEFLSRPEDSKPGAGGKGGKVKNALNDIVGNIIAGL